MFLLSSPPVPLVLIFPTITVSQMTLIESIYSPCTTLGLSFHWWVVIWSSVWNLVNPLAVVAFLLPWSPHWLPPGLVMSIGHLWTIYWRPGTCRFTPPLSLLSFSPLERPMQPSGYFLSHFLLYRYVHKVNWYIFDQGEMYWGLWMTCRNYHSPLSFIHLMYTYCRHPLVSKYNNNIVWWYI